MYTYAMNTSCTSVGASKQRQHWQSMLVLPSTYLCFCMEGVQGPVQNVCGLLKYSGGSIAA
jgi:hypothetical protein